MKKKILANLKILGGLSVGFLLHSCELKEDFDQQNTVQEVNYQESSGDMLVLGKQKENPYSVTNMQKAYANISSGGRTAEFDIRTTDLYVRFLPADSLELQILMSDTSMVFWDYPLDFEVELIGHYYHDPSVPDSLPTYQYSVVKPDFEFPNMKYQVLAELFLPDEYEDEKEDGRVSGDFLEALEYEALRITGNLEDDEQSGSPTSRILGSKWRPAGKVTVREAVSNQTTFVATATSKWLPVKNVKVKAKRWFHLSSAYTDTQGNYSLDRFRGKVDYKIEFESDRIKVTNALGWSRNHNGPNNQKSGWNPAFDWWSESWANATVLNAAYECRVQVNQKRMQSPFPQAFWAGSGRAVDKLNIRIKYDEGTGRMIVKPFTINEVKIWTSHENGQRKGTDYLYRVTFHELGHSMHARLGGSLLFTAKILRESWADFIEHSFILAYYPAQNEYSNLQGEEKKEMSDGYTPLFIDLVDTENQLVTRGGDKPQDLVEKYSLLQLQESLVKNNQLVEVRDHLKSNYNNPTESHLDKLFDFYIDISVK